ATIDSAVVNTDDGQTYEGTTTLNGGVAFDADHDGNGSGTFSVTGSIGSGGNNFSITAADMDLTGTLNAGAGTITITSSNGGDISLGLATGGLTLSNAQLAKITPGNLAPDVTRAGNITLAGATRAPTNNPGLATPC